MSALTLDLQHDGTGASILDLVVEDSGSTVLPLMVAPLSVSGVTASSITLSWPPAIAGTFPILEYRLSTNGAAYVSVGLNYSVDVSPLASGTLYNFSILAFDDQGNAAPAPIQSSASTQGVAPSIAISTMRAPLPPPYEPGWTKGQIIEEALGELALQGHVFNLGADEMKSALRRLDMMMATWNAKGIRVGYALPTRADGSDLDQMSGLPDMALEAVMLNLAIRLAGGYGKALPPQTMATAKAAYDVLIVAAAKPIEQQYPAGVPRGAGSKPYRLGTYFSPFIPSPRDPLAPGADSEFEFN